MSKKYSYWKFLIKNVKLQVVDLHFTGTEQGYVKNAHARQNVNPNHVCVNKNILRSSKVINQLYAATNNE